MKRIVAGEKELLRLNLSFFAESSGGEKTEAATPRKKEKARKEGQVAKSQELGTAALFIFAFMGLRMFAGYIYDKMLAVFGYSFEMLGEYENIMNTEYMAKYISFMFMQLLLAILPVFAVCMAVGIIINFIQVGWHPTSKPLKPKFSKLNPINGFKRLFSARALVELVKSLAKFGVIIFVIYNMMVSKKEIINNFMFLDLMEAMILIGNIAIDLGMNVGYVYLVIAVLDYAYQIFKQRKELRMTKQEIKEEYKESEGNPQIKGQIRQKMREASMRRMMQSVPSADVIITNPTHFAVALKWDKENSDAPIVVAKGADHLAARIKDVARENGIVIVENKPIARALYGSVEIGHPIPPELYKAVAEIIAYVYSLKQAA